MINPKIDRKITTEVHIERNVRPLLRGDMLKLHERLLAIAVTKSLSFGIPLKSVHVYVSRDPEENTSVVVFEINVEASAVQALAFWEALGVVIDGWRGGLTEYLRTLFTSRWSIRVRWLGNGFGQV